MKSIIFTETYLWHKLYHVEKKVYFTEIHFNNSLIRFVLNIIIFVVRTYKNWGVILLYIHT